MKQLIVILSVQLLLCCSVLLSQPVANTVVDPFTGSLGCSVPVLTIPGPYGGGYSVVLNYNSDVQAEDEASWVGYGWSLESPSISRQRRGYPDDLKDRTVSFLEKGSISTTTVRLLGNTEILSTNFVGDNGTAKATGEPFASASVGLSLTLSFNSITGFDATASPSVGGSIGLNGQVSLGLGVSIDTKGRFGIGGGLGVFGGGAGTNLYSYDPKAKNRPLMNGIRSFEGTSWMVETSVTVTGAKGPFGGGELGAGIGNTVINFIGKDFQFNGYLYSPDIWSEQGSTRAIADYLIERERPLDGTKPSPLPIPLPGFDIFHVSAPGLQGKFRIHHPVPLAFQPGYTECQLTITNFSGKAILGTSNGGGLGTAFPVPVRYKVSQDGPFSPQNGQVRELVEWRNIMQPFFRYYDEPAEPLRMSLDQGPASVSYDGLNMAAFHPVNRNRLPLMNRSIAHRTIGEAKSLIELSNPKAVSNEKSWFGTIKSSDLPDEGICEFTITNEDGAKAEFGAPTFAYQEESQTLITSIDGAGEHFSTPRTTNRIHYSNNPLSLRDAKDGSGKIIKTPYASKWNITAMYGSTYVDVNGNGPDKDDVGAWTKFSYAEESERRWRSPYSGYFVEKREPRKTEDDMLSFSNGKIKPRYLRTIETATHIAVFFTSTRPKVSSDEQAISQINSASIGVLPARKDALEPPTGDNEGKASGLHTEVKNAAPYLQRIELWLKNSSGQPVKKLSTVHFSYDYSCWPGNPSTAVVNGSSDKTGKLTLRRVWVEDYDVKESTIKPIDFFYTYPDVSGSGTSGTAEKDKFSKGSLASRYDASIFNFPSVTETPSYNANTIDAWGEHTGITSVGGTATGASDLQKFTPPQLGEAIAGNIDPAAYKLKTIRNSLGGRTVPVYERRDYVNVQDQDVLGLTPLDANGTWDVSLSATIPNGIYGYVINPKNVGVNSTSMADVNAYIEKLTTRFVNGGEYMFFKFAYQQKNCDGSSSAEKKYYSRGYCKATSITLVPPPAPITATSEYRIRISLGNSQPILPIPSAFVISKNQETTPYSAAFRYWKTFDRTACVGQPSGALGFVSTFSNLGDYMVSPLAPIPLGILPKLLPEVSLLRLPLAHPKLGGGVRVQRLLNISPDGILQSGDAAAVGTIYQYQDGAATNEPFLMREECPLVGILKSYIPDNPNKMLDEESLALAEGPIGSSLLPAPSIGYASVSMKSINSKGATTGVVKSRYLTVKEYPSLIATVGPAKVDKYQHDINSLGMFMSSTFKLEMRQSFAFALQDYHGLPLSMERYAKAVDSDRLTLLASSRTEYLSPSDTVWRFVGTDRPMRGHKPIDWMDICSEGRSWSENMDMKRGDLSLAWPGTSPIPAPGFGFISYILDNNIKTAVSTSITRYTPRVRRSISMNDGKIDTTLILAYDIRTGFPAITQVSDDYDGTFRAVPIASGNATPLLGKITNISVPAISRYPELAQKSTTIGMRLGEFNGRKQDNPVIGQIQITNDDATKKLTFTRSTTLDQTVRNSEFTKLFRVGDIYHIYDNSNKIIRVVQACSVSATGSTVDVWYFIHSGTLALSGQIGVHVVESGLKNYLTQSTEQHTVYGLDLEPSFARARELMSYEDFDYLFHGVTRNGFTNLNFKYLDYYNTGAFPMKWQASVNSFLPTTMQKDDVNTEGPCLGTVSATESKFAYANILRSEYNATLGMQEQFVYAGIFLPSGSTGVTIAPEGFAINCNVPRKTVWEDNQYCGYPWFDAPCFQTVFPNCTNPPNSPVQARDKHPWDRWRRFYVADNGSLVVGSVKPAMGALNSGGLQFNLTNAGRFEIIPSTARYLALNYVPWMKVFSLQGSSSVVGYDHWMPVSGWNWQTSQTIDASGAAGATSVGNYDKAGTFSRPGNPPQSNPGTIWGSPRTVGTNINLIAPSATSRHGWYQGTLITSVDKFARPTEMRSPLDILENRVSIIQYGRDGFSTEAAFTNSSLGSCWYESFETNGTSTDGFTGSWSTKIESNSITVSRPAHAPITTLTAEPTSALLRFWAKANPEGQNTIVDLGLTAQGVSITQDHIKATVNGWALVEMEITSNFSTITLAATGIVRVDDLMVLGINASSTATVVDDEYRPVAQFDANHFPTKVKYNQPGYTTSAESIMLTGTVAYQQNGVNIPGISRTTEFREGGVPSSSAFYGINGLMPNAEQEIRNVSQEKLNTIQMQTPTKNGSIKGRLINIDASANGVKTESEIAPVNSLLNKLIPTKNSSDSTVQSKIKKGEKP